MRNPSSMSYSPPVLSLTEFEPPAYCNDVNSDRLRPRKQVSATRTFMFSSFVPSCPILALRNNDDSDCNASTSRRNSSIMSWGRKLGIIKYPLIDRISRSSGDSVWGEEGVDTDDAGAFDVAGVDVDDKVNDDASRHRR